MVDEETKQLRIHVGNISPKLAENHLSLSTRLGKFGKIIQPLELHTKPVQDYHFGFITLELTNNEFEKLKNAFNGILFMGMKLTIGIAKQNFPESWIKDSKRPDLLKLDRLKRERIQQARKERIIEAHTSYPVNSVTGSIISNTSSIGSSSMGYSKSSHTFNNMSGNTKNTQPTQTLIGIKSYGSDTTPSNVTGHIYSRMSGSGEVIKGTHRVTKRPNIHFSKGQQTLRILVNGELKQIKCYKGKLWGMEKNKTARDLTWRYSNGAWKSGDDHIIEKNTTVKIKDPIIGGPSQVQCAIDGDQANAYGEGLDQHAVGDDEINEEINKNSNILASLLSKHDFEKSLSLSDVEDNGIDENDIIYDSKGRRKVTGYDYEAEGKQIEDEQNDSEDSFDYEKANEILDAYKKTVERPKEETYYDEDDEGNELDLDALGRQYTTEAISDKYDEEHGFDLVDSIDSEPEDDEEDKKVDEIKEEPEDDEEDKKVDEIKEDEIIEEPPILTTENREDSEEEEDFIPTFGAPKSPQVNDTDTLRSLFNPNQTVSETPQESQFKLALSEDDEDVDNKATVDETQHNELLNKIKSKQQEEANNVQISRSNKFGLFWPHSDSPFLQSQSQINKIGTFDDSAKLPGESDSFVSKPGEESAYEQWFWQMRGEFSRECKRRRRDVLRIFKKKTNKNSII